MYLIKLLSKAAFFFFLTVICQPFFFISLVSAESTEQKSAEQDFYVEKEKHQEYILKSDIALSFIIDLIYGTSSKPNTKLKKEDKKKYTMVQIVEKLNNIKFDSNIKKDTTIRLPKIHGRDIIQENLDAILKFDEGNFEDAKKRFDDILKSNPKHRAAKKYQKRCDKKISQTKTVKVTTPAEPAPKATAAEPPKNNAPEATDGALTVKEGRPAKGTLTAKDKDRDDKLTYSIVDQPQKGKVEITDAAAGTYTYTPNAGVTGANADSFTFKANDGKNDSNIAKVNINIIANKAPVAHDSELKVTKNKQEIGNLSASDQDNDTLTYEVVDKPKKGKVDITEKDAFTYTPTPNETGEDNFTFKANDGVEDSSIATVSITIIADIKDNKPPRAADISVTTKKNTPTTGNLNATDEDKDDILTYSVVSQPAHGAVTVDDPKAGAFTYKPANDYVGSDSFTFKAHDTKAASSNEAKVNITVKENSAPKANSLELSTVKNVQIVGKTLEAKDEDNDKLTYKIVKHPKNGTVTIDKLPQFTYTPTKDYVGSDSFTFTANDGTGDSNTATVTIKTEEEINPAELEKRLNELIDKIDKFDATQINNAKTEDELNNILKKIGADIVEPHFEIKEKLKQLKNTDRIEALKKADSELDKKLDSIYTESVKVRVKIKLSDL